MISYRFVPLSSQKGVHFFETPGMFIFIWHSFFAKSSTAKEGKGAWTKIARSIKHSISCIQKETSGEGMFKSLENFIAYFKGAPLVFRSSRLLRVSSP